MIKKNLLRAGVLLAALLLAWGIFSVESAAEVKPYTIMVYMNGSDLETEHGMATDDIIEMLESGLDSRAANLVLLTGGTLRWLNDVVPDVKCVIWELRDGYIYEVENLGVWNMGDPGTLVYFLNFCKDNYPAEKYGLIMWDHGGGSIAGFGHDEVFDEDNLSLLDMRLAFEAAGLAADKLEFLGFDSCLMATVEMGVIGSRYAKFMIASEDLEPGEGWDYSFLRELNKNPGIGGDELGIYIVDYFMRFFDGIDDEPLHLSVIDLNKTGEVMAELGGLMEVCRDSMGRDQMPAFRNLASRRGATKTFGVGSPRDNESDMVDIGDMAMKLYDLFPERSEAVLKALDEAVLYSRDNSDINLRGLSTYYIYGGRDTADVSLETYASLGMSGDYTLYLKDFAAILLGRGNARVTRGGAASGGGNAFDYDNLLRVDAALYQRMVNGELVIVGIQRNDPFPMPDWTLWPTLNGMYACLYEAGRTANAVQYAIPARHNGNDCDIIVSFGVGSPEGNILGVRNEDGFVIQKGTMDIEPGDKLAFYYQIPRNNGESSWILGQEFTAGANLTLDWVEPNEDDTAVGLILTDIYNNRLFIGKVDIESAQGENVADNAA
ncbi:MAG: clostripain-related cysteine peptidase [Defluviitaleaceae bacterium]|nr:clostripain-related cysteine peptidase [Defluviitaleaceae bacterium]MCL2836292.1 clostripain-related cysteine peptidase [Defluviitaleaceae bacterium]